MQKNIPNIPDFQEGNCQRQIFLKSLPQDKMLSSVTQSCPILCHPTDCSTPGFPVTHQLPELTQIHVHQVGDAIQPSHPLSSLLLPPSIFPSIRVFSSELVLHSSARDFPGRTTRVGCHFLLQGIFLIQGSKPGLLHCTQILYCLSHLPFFKSSLFNLLQYYFCFTFWIFGCKACGILAP